MPLLFVVGIAYGNFSGGGEPSYVSTAMDSVSNKLSYDYGRTHCKANQHEVDNWTISCSTSTVPTTLIFSVLPAEKAPYNIVTPYYLIADNDAAKKASTEGLLSFLMTTGDAKPKQVKQLAAH